MPLYEVVLQCEYFGQQVINRWNYEMTGTPAGISGSAALLQAIGFIPSTIGNALPSGSVGKILQSMQVDNMVWQQCLAKNIYDPVDFFDNPYVVALTGDITGVNGAPPFSAYGFRTSRVRTDIDRGTKRFAGVPVSYILDGGVWDSSAVTLMESLAEAMTETLPYTDSGNSLTFTPTIVSKEKYTTPSGKFAYRYYATEVAQDDHLAQGFLWQPYATVRTQVSRQYGKGD